MHTFPMNLVLQTIGEPATFTPAAGSPVDCYAKRIMGGRETVIGGVRIVADTSVFHVARAHVTAPAAGDVLNVDGADLTIEVVEPAPDDPQNLLWQVTADWGVLVTWARSSGKGETQHPPSAPNPTASAAALGTSLMTIVSSYAVGLLKAGDQFTIAGDVTVYTVQADVSATVAGFENVSISPVLAAATSGGEVVELETQAEVSIRAALSDYEPAVIMGAVEAGDRRLVLRDADMAAVGRTTVEAGDAFEVAGETWCVAGATAHFEGSVTIAWDVRLQR